MENTGIPLLKNIEFTYCKIKRLDDCIAFFYIIVCRHQQKLNVDTVQNVALLYKCDFYCVLVLCH